MRNILEKVTRGPRLVLTQLRNIARRIVSILLFFGALLWNLALRAFRWIRQQSLVFVQAIKRNFQRIKRIGILLAAVGSIFALCWFFTTPRAILAVGLAFFFPFILLVGTAFVLRRRARPSLFVIFRYLRRGAKSSFRSAIWLFCFSVVIFVYFITIILIPVIISAGALKSVTIGPMPNSIFEVTLENSSLIVVVLKYYFVAGGCLLVGLMIYYLRTMRQALYGIIEVGIGIVLMSANYQTMLVLLVGDFQSVESTPALALAAGVYVVVRGLDNVQKGVSKGSFASTLLTEAPASIDSTVGETAETLKLAVKAYFGRAT
jgi:hypothetical protein